MNPLLLIALQFSNRQAITGLQPLGNGLINDTYLVTTAAACFVLQRVNRQVFPVPELISANLLALNQHVRQKVGAKLQLPEMLRTNAGQLFYQADNGDFWRAQSFIADTKSLETLGSSADAEQAGFALGHFHHLFSDLDPVLLHDTLPGFHITPRYLSHYHKVLRQASIKDPYCGDFIEQFGHFADMLEQAKQQGLLPLRVIHGDPKLNNFLFGITTRRAVSLIDLDTVKPGLVHYDIGDCLRSCCHVEETDEFNLAICAVILKSYLAEAGSFFSPADYDYLYPAIQLIPFELGLRFYTDYLEGNRYFKVTGPLQNLQRAQGQFRLTASILAQEVEIKALIARLRHDNLAPDGSGNA
ncbi:MAG: aminoglycoside phosphotransferase family protein [Methylovulum sp.]|nr:aminoglycoside phosphotransferase family protein [Methylovulum sp.]